MFTRYGYSTLGIIAITTFLLTLFSSLVNNEIIKILIILIPLIFLLFSFYFFRDPDRIPPQKDNVVISPADGKVLVVKDVLDNKFINGKAKQVSIFMSPLNVHVNRIPINGKVDYLEYHKGKFISAFRDKASENNERAEFGITSRFGKIFYTQVAGFIARRIVYEIKPGDLVVAGKRFGMIKFGSRVDVVVPESWQAKVNKGDRVTAGETILFEFKS